MDEETKFPPCPFCGTGGLTAEYDSFGTALYCEGCHGTFNFPAFIEEVQTMWLKNKLNEWADSFIKKYIIENSVILHKGDNLQEKDKGNPV